MSWFAKHKIEFSSLLYQYTDGGGSPEDIDAWDNEDLEYLAELVRLELAKRTSVTPAAPPAPAQGTD